MNLSTSINAAPEAVFAIVSDVENSPDRIDWYENVEMLTDGPVRVGTKWRETRSMNNKQSVEEWEMTAFESPRYFSAYCDSHGYDVEWTMRVDPEGTGSKLTLVMTTRPRTFIGKLMTPVEWLMSGMMKSIVRKDLESTRAFIEQDSSVSTREL
ncbi:MAG: SRPBCC family protein [Woeseiaceae bacterium]